MKKLLVTLLLFMSASGCAVTIPFKPRPLPEAKIERPETEIPWPAPWTNKQKIMLIASMIAAGADWYTTKRRVCDMGDREMNRLIGPHPSERTLILRGWGLYGGYLLTCHVVPSELREIMLLGQTTMNTGFALGNARSVTQRR